VVLWRLTLRFVIPSWLRTLVLVEPAVSSVLSDSPENNEAKKEGQAIRAKMKEAFDSGDCAADCPNLCGARRTRRVRKGNNSGSRNAHGQCSGISTGLYCSPTSFSVATTREK
jgi:hypothetical protein